MGETQLRLFAMNATHAFGERVAADLGLPLSPHEEREFEDGEHKSRSLVNVRGCDVFVIQTLAGDESQSVNDKLIRLLFFIGALRDASAARVTAVVPYFGYARKDAKTKPRDPVTTRYMAALFEAVGTDRVLALDVHNLAAFQNAFRCHTDHLDASALFARHFHACLGDTPRVAVVSPDAGGVKRAERLQRMLQNLRGSELPLAFMEKVRSRGQLRGGRLVGDVDGATVVILDDLISTGSTLTLAARACRSAGAAHVFAAATHGLFADAAEQTLADAALEKVNVTDSIPVRLSVELIRRKVSVLPVAKLFADAIGCIHSGGSIVELLDL